LFMILNGSVRPAQRNPQTPGGRTGIILHRHSASPKSLREAIWGNCASTCSPATTKSN
ncbi:hypothetical protein V5799_013990, partial [Amblyomma americanum]